MENKVAILGDKGFLAKQFVKNKFDAFPDRINYEIHAEEFVHKISKDYSALVNCVGCADTRLCENPKNWGYSFMVNADIPRWLSYYCKKYDVKFVQISSGCVYDKNNIPQTEDTQPSSHCRYVVTKIAGEYGCDPEKDLILRPRLYFGETENKNNLLTKLPKFDRHLTEINSFTSVQTIVEATTALLDNNQSGIFNVAQEGYSTIKDICKLLGIPPQDDIDGVELQKKCELALVNNILDISKLKNFYQPRNLEYELRRCWEGYN